AIGGRRCFRDVRRSRCRRTAHGEAGYQFWDRSTMTIAMQTESELERKCQDSPCRSCGRVGLLPVLDLGSTPLADGLITREGLGRPEPFFPLEVAFCPGCTLV